MPFVSVIIPAYNVGCLIGKCIESVKAQKFTDWELIIVDDGSQDDTLAYCNKYAESEERLTVIHTNNHGAFEARMTGVKAAKGEWVMFADSDDTLTSNAISDLIKYIHKDIDLIVGTLNLNNKSLFQHKVNGKLSSKQYTEALLAYKTSIGPVAKLYRRSLFCNEIVKPKKKIQVNEDFLLLLSITSFARNIYVAKDVVCYNYNFRENTMRTFTMPISEWTYLFDLIEQIIGQYNDKLLYRAFFALKLNRVYNVMIMQGNYISKHDELYRQIFSSEFISDVSPAESKILAILRSHRKQVIARTQNQIKRKAIRLAKIILRR